MIKRKVMGRSKDEERKKKRKGKRMSVIQGLGRYVNIDKALSKVGRGKTDGNEIKWKDRKNNTCSRKRKSVIQGLRRFSRGG